MQTCVLCIHTKGDDMRRTAKILTNEYLVSGFAGRSLRFMDSCQIAALPAKQALGNHR